mmetsp:Transcript_67974/g.196945  ORF Transcript_67974/g.196945 Transcript_67974/m.196945 type:complete len:100 (-) Transcript_67974:949-1248(-)
MCRRRPAFIRVAASTLNFIICCLCLLRIDSVHGSQDPLLLRVARGELTAETPVWMMRQAGRHMAAYRAIQDPPTFRQKSETPDVSLEISLQPFKACKPV